MAKSNFVGWFKDLKVWNPQSMEVQNLFKAEEESLPIVGNDLTRVKVFKELWSYLAERLAHKLRIQSDEDGIFQMICILVPLTEIITYPLSEKKESGLGALTNARENIDFDDKVLKMLIQINNNLESIRLTKIHVKHYPLVKKQIKELQTFHRKALSEYVWAYKREARFLRICGESIDRLNAFGLKNGEIKQIVKEALVHFEKNGFKIHIKSLDRIFNKEFYKTVHSPGLLEDGTDVSSYYIEKVSKKKG